MNEREKLMVILDCLGIRYILNENKSYLEMENHYFRDNISMDFNNDGEIVAIYCEEFNKTLKPYHNEIRK